MRRISGWMRMHKGGPLPFLFLASFEALVEPEDSIRYYLYTPPGYTGQEDRPYPVIVHLHGAMPFPWTIAKRMGHSHVSALGNAMEELSVNDAVQPAVIIAPYDGFGFSMWSDSSTGHVTVETDVVSKILPEIVETMNVAATRDQTRILGFSMGGFGALKIGLKYPEKFGRVTSWDGAVHDWQTLSDTRPGIVANMFASENDFDAHSPWIAASQLDPSTLPAIHLFSGSMAAPSTYTEKFRRRLTNIGLSFEFEETTCPQDLICFMTNQRVENAYASRE
ncbi:alpha/beta hydrolase [Tateyamaria sp. SN3-11]|uniref:alpha/beta hydrolase n=1 Tax=Tateyamaria sp. SN3-11 TaxID=3092147 RepID=UPI0039ED464E